jgi:peptide/nickel transport system permease protein
MAGIDVPAGAATSQGPGTAHPIPAAAIGRPRRGPGLVPAVPLTILSVFIAAAILAPILTPYDPQRNALIESLTPPFWVAGGSPEHWLGTDSFGRDVFARLLYGARVSFAVAAVALVIGVVIGTAVGVTAGFVGGKLEALLMRIVDILLALPALLIALVVAIAVGPSFQNLVLILGFLTWPRIARLLRTETSVQKTYDFVRYSKAIGVRDRLIIVRHILHNILPTLLVATTLEIGSIILREASISFLGAGLPPSQASWGVMIADGQALISTGWWIALFPGLAIVLTVLSCNALGDWLRDVLDPKTVVR